MANLDNDKINGAKVALQAISGLLDDLNQEKSKVEQYLEDSSKTLSGVFYADMDTTEPDIFYYAKKAIMACNDLDLVKKKKFYNKEVNLPTPVLKSSTKFLRDGAGENTLHAGIGLLTECSEILEAVITHKYDDKPLDVVNLKEEIGDVMWYLAILFRDHKIDIFEAMETNIAKLRARYGEKFSTEKANNRDLKTERSILEGNPLMGISKVLPANSTYTRTDSRTLENGGMAPPVKDWKNLVEDKLDVSQKNVLLRQMKEIYEKGETVTTNLPAVILYEDFSEGFSYLEEPKGYNGAFLVKVLKSIEDIKKEAKALNIDIDKDVRFPSGVMANVLQGCKDSQLILTSVVDINSKTSNGEEKKFLIAFGFNNLTGEVSLSNFLFSGKESKTLSMRQDTELDKFCLIKQISRY